MGSGGSLKVSKELLVQTPVRGNMVSGSKEDVHSITTVEVPLSKATRCVC